MFVRPVFTHNLCAAWTIKCIHWIQNTQMNINPIEPVHKPANDTALGNASIPVPMLPFITCIIVCSILLFIIKGIWCNDNKKIEQYFQMGSWSFFNLTYDKECSFSSLIIAPLRVIETFFDEWPSADSFPVDSSDLAWSLSSGSFSSFIPSNSGIVLKRALLFYLKKSLILLKIPISNFQCPFVIFKLWFPLIFTLTMNMWCSSIFEITLFVQCDQLQILSIVNNNIIFEQCIWSSHMSNNNMINMDNKIQGGM